MSWHHVTIKTDPLRTETTQSNNRAEPDHALTNSLTESLIIDYNTFKKTIMASSNPETQATLSLHAEFLPNIRQITLYITLLTNLDPIISLSESRRAVTVSLPEPYDDVSETIKLPARVNEAARWVLEGRQHPGTGNGTRDKGELGSNPGLESGNRNERELSFRMQIDPGDTGGGLIRPEDEVTSEEYVPWMAGDMGSYTRLGCRECGNVVLDCAPTPAPGDTGSGWVWKDLPSGNWAEMMDFWHCHKPDAHDHDDDDHTVSIEERNSQVKGYGAANQVVASSGTGLVDVATFLVAEGDCRELKVRSSSLLYLVSLVLFLAIMYAHGRATRRRLVHSMDLSSIQLPYINLSGMRSQKLW